MAPNKSLKAVAFEGAIWAASYAVAAKIVSFASQLVLAWLLVPADFGLVAMANSAMFLLSIIQSGGLRSVLIRRHKKIDLWSVPAFWFSMALALSAFTIAMVIMPWLARYYSEPRLWTLMPVMALGILVDSLSIVPTARLQADLRFRALGAINILSPIGQAFFSIALAYAGFGALSIVAPKIPVGLLVAAVLWRQSNFIFSWRPQFGRWKYLASDSFYMLASWLAFAAAAQAPLVVLSRVHGASVVGLYSFAISITTQVITLLTSQLDSVLFPALAKLKEWPEKQWLAFFKSTRILGFTVFAISGLQYLLADPLITHLFASRWHDAVPLVQLFSLGNAVLAAAIPTGGIMQAKGAVSVYFRFSVFSVILATLCALAGHSFEPNGMGVAYGAVAYQVTISITAWIIVSRLFAVHMSSLMRALLLPYCVSFGAAWITSQIVGHHVVGNVWIEMFIMSFTYIIVWSLGIFALWRGPFIEMFKQAKNLIHEKNNITSV